MNALAGGGSFVSLPILLAAGVPPILANTSSTVALFPGGLVSAWAYRAELTGIGTVPLRTLLAATLCGGFFGAALLLKTSAVLFKFMLPWLLLLASIGLAFGRRIGEALRKRCHMHSNAVLVSQFVLGVYGGYFGGAVGIMMVVVWGLFDKRELKHLNGPRTLLVSVANMVAVIAFIVAGAVSWPETLALMFGAIIGGYGGAYIGLRARPGVIRAITLFSTFCITLAFFINTYA